MHDAVAWPAEHCQVRLVAVMRDAPGHDVVDINPDTVNRAATTTTTRSAFCLERTSALSLPFRPVQDIGCGSNPLGDAGAASATLDVALDRRSAVRAIALGAFGCASTCHARRLVLRQHELPASLTRRLRRADPLATQFVRACPAPSGLAVTRCRLARLAVAGRTAPLFRRTRRAALGAQLDTGSAVDAVLGRVRLMGDLARLAARGVAGDRDRAVSAESCRHRTNMIPDRGSR